jgi:hypothetical protein
MTNKVFFIMTKSAFPYNDKKAPSESQKRVMLFGICNPGLLSCGFVIRFLQ